MKIGSPDSPSHKWLVFATIATGTFLTVVDIGIINLALPSIQRHFGQDLQTLKWVTVAYSLAISMLLLPFGRLGDLFGRKRLYVIGLVIFLVAVILGGMSQSILMLIVMKAIQGIGGAMIQGNGMATVVSAFPEEERGKALGFHMSVVGAGAVAGPVLGGLLVDSFGWRSVFYVNIPLLIIGIAAAATILERDRQRESPRVDRARFDWPGAALSAGALLLFMLAISEGGRSGWTSAPIIAACLLFVALLAAFIFWELRAPAPMLDLRLFRHRLVAFGIATGFITFMTNISVIFMMTFYIQQVLGFDPKRAGFLMIAGPIALGVCGPISGRLSDRFGWRTLTVVGQALCATSLFLLAFKLTEDTSPAFLVAVLAMSSTGLGLFNSPNASSVLSAVERPKYGVVSGLMQLVRNSAQVTSIAVTTTIVVATMASLGFVANLETVKAGGSVEVRHAFILGLHRVYFIMGALSVLGIVLTLIKGDRAREHAHEPASSRAIPSAADSPR